MRFTTLQSSMKLGGVAFTIALASPAGMAADPVRESFDRMLAHAPAPAAAPAQAATDPADPLVAALVMPFRDGPWPARDAAPADPVVASFARMLDHQPSRHAPAAPTSVAVDPPFAAVVWPLLRSGQYTVAAAATPALR